MKSLETQKEFMRLRAAGLSLKEISEKVGVAKSTCCIWEKKFSLELGELRKLELEALYKECEATNEARLRMLHRSLKKVNEAIAEVDFSAIPPERLFDIQFRLINTIGNYYKPLDLHKSMSDLLASTDSEYPDDWERQAEKDAKLKISPDLIQENADSDQN